jgi:class 3 adenylate cyclase/tetratricopeptide (TPR) repeat protein
MRCPRCAQDTVAGARFCQECGAPLAVACAACGESLPAGARFCPACGTAVAGAPAREAERAAAPAGERSRERAEQLIASAATAGERKQVTVLFADLKGSMEFLADRDPEEARAVLDAVLRLMLDAVHRYDGTVNQVMGDGIMALFGAPVADEDHAVQACYAAWRIQQDVTRYAEDLARREGVQVHVRVGLNSGEVVVRAIGSDLHMDYTAVGQTTHLAARMEQMAAPGAILLTGSTVTLAGDSVRVRALGPRAVKGLEAPVEVYELVGTSAALSLSRRLVRRLTPFVGREPELEVLEAAARSARGGAGRVVAVVGEAGVGKSRLVDELVVRAGEAMRLRRAAAVSYGRTTPYLPVVQLLRDRFGVDETDTGAAVAARVEAGLAGAGDLGEDVRSAVLFLLDAPAPGDPFPSLEPVQRRRRIREALVRLLLAETPLLLVWENVHWADEETLGLLDALVAAAERAPALLVATYRPEHAPRWRGQPHLVELRVEPLPPPSAERMLDSLLGPAPDLAPLKGLLVARTQGNPFFMEESVRTLVESGALLGEPGAFRLGRVLETIQVPATVQAVLAARIDRLAPEDKSLLQSAAVIGKDTPLELLQAVTEWPQEALRRGLGMLEAAGFLEENREADQVAYAFRHALTHEVAYASLLREQRRVRHARIVEAMEKLYSDRLGSQVARLALHAFRGEIWDRAVGYARQAGARAVERSANREAVASFEQALAALRHLPATAQSTRTAIELQLEMRAPLLQLGRLQDGLTASQEAERLAQGLGDEQALARVYTYLINYHYLKGEPALAIQYGERCLQVGDAHDDAGLRALARQYLGQVHHVQGEYRRAEAVLQANVEALEAAAEPPTVAYVASCGWLAFTLADLGEFEAAAAFGERARGAAEGSGHPYSEVIAWTLQGLVELRRGALAAARTPLARSLEACRATGLSLWQPIPSVLLGLVHVREGRPAEGLPLLERGVALSEELGIVAYRALWMAALAEGRLAAGAVEEAHEAALAALRLARRHGEHGHEAWALARLGAVEDAGGATDKAVGYLRQALAGADRAGMRPLVAEASLALARLLRRHGRRENAEELVTRAVALFHELGLTGALAGAREELAAHGGIVIVGRTSPALYDALTQPDTGDSLVVILDRRSGDRRVLARAEMPERRQTERRQHPEVDDRLRRRPLVVIPGE